jgi:hypothetical protein
VIRRDVIDGAAAIRERFEAASPFPHALVENFLKDEAAELLLRDFPAFDERHAMNEHGTVGRKAVVERVTAVSQFYARFYRYINSREFLDAMSALTGIPDLIADETLHGGGTHENLDGQGLDVHVDFNIDERRMLHRRVNLLIYLNKEWRDDWGGLIEFHSDPRDPQHNVIRSFRPLFNHAVIFATSEHSWHGFQQISLPADRKHLSRKSRAAQGEMSGCARPISTRMRPRDPSSSVSLLTTRPRCPRPSKTRRANAPSPASASGMRWPTSRRSCARRGWSKGWSTSSSSTRR